MEIALDAGAEDVRTPATCSRCCRTPESFEAVQGGARDAAGLPSRRRGHDGAAVDGRDLAARPREPMKLLEVARGPRRRAERLVQHGHRPGGARAAVGVRRRGRRRKCGCSASTRAAAVTGWGVVEARGGVVSPSGERHDRARIVDDARGERLASLHVRRASSSVASVRPAALALEKRVRRPQRAERVPPRRGARRRAGRGGRAGVPRPRVRSRAGEARRRRLRARREGRRSCAACRAARARSRRRADEADALALALCHLIGWRLRSLRRPRGGGAGRRCDRPSRGDDSRRATRRSSSTWAASATRSSSRCRPSPLCRPWAARCELLVHARARGRAAALRLPHAAERALFQLLRSVSGIGPRLALNILSGMPTAELAEAIRRRDLGPPAGASRGSARRPPSGSRSSWPTSSPRCRPIGRRSAMAPAPTWPPRRSRRW